MIWFVASSATGQLILADIEAGHRAKVRESQSLSPSVIDLPIRDVQPFLQNRSSQVHFISGVNPSDSRIVGSKPSVLLAGVPMRAKLRFGHRFVQADIAVDMRR